MGKLFGTDGVRGIANKELTPELAFDLGRAAGHFFNRDEGRRQRILIGKDTRLSGGMLEAALAAGLTSVGVDVELLGVLPTPGVAFLCRELKADAGVMISASHNPVADNGIKFFDREGYKLSDAAEAELEDIYFSNLEQLPRPIGIGVGQIRLTYEAVQSYEDYLVSTTEQSFAGLRIVVDCGYGAAYQLAPAVFRRLGAEVIVLHGEADGARINVNCGSTNVTALCQAVVEHQAHLGIAHDGDADRVIAVDETGTMVDGDAILTVCGLDLLQRGQLDGKQIAVTVYSNLGVTQVFRKHGGDVTITANGDRYVLEALRKQGLVLGGEQSGHIIFLKKNSTGDGIITAVQLISVMARSGQSLSKLAGQLERFPQVLENVRVNHKDGWESNARIQQVLSEAEHELAGVGRVFVRASGTEPLIRVMAEGPEAQRLQELVGKIVTVVKSELN